MQVFETSTTNTLIVNESYVYETDTVKVTYAFWRKNGIMSFTVFNKLDQPIYIDWKKSSYIPNSNKLNYWVDEERSKSISYYGGYFYNGPSLREGVTVNLGTASSSTSKIKIERITFIPPKSSYHNYPLHLLSKPYVKIPIDTKSQEIRRNDNPRMKTKVYEVDYSKDSSPLRFRNFLTLSLTEDFQNEFYIDCEFYVSKIKEMDYRHFEKYNLRDNNGRYVYVTPFTRSTAFFVSVPKYGNVEYRRKYGE